MRQYKIAFFTADWNYELVESTLKGLQQYVNAHRNVVLRVFDCFGRDEDNAKERSEYAIYELPELRDFDGVLIQGNQIVLSPIREALSRKVIALNIPAISIGCPIEGCSHLGVDNRQAQYDIVQHLIQAHRARRMVYLTGILDNGCPEAHQRLSGFLDACRDSGIAPGQYEVIVGTWRTSDGVETARDWLQSARPLPDAFVCANDEMALGIMEYLADQHISVPEDVMVTGFDNVSSAELSSPRLSTIQRHYSQIMIQAMTRLVDKIEGRDCPDYIPASYRMVCSESCGCASAAPQDYIRKKYFRQTRFLKNFYMHQDVMAGNLLEADNLLELMNTVEANPDIFGCEMVRLCINDFYFDSFDKRDWDPHNAFGREMILTCRDCGRGFERFPTADLLPEPEIAAERFLVFYPLHYNTYSIGYLVMNGISEAAKLNLHKSIFNFIEIAAENVRKKGLLRQLNSELGELYIHDGLTGLYNRFGLESVGRETFDTLMTRDGCAQILFIDMDDMKTINDRFGHEMGDLAIRTAAELIKAACQDAFVMRYGGDEFLVIASGKLSGLENAIQQNAAERRTLNDTPFHLSLSIGIIRSECDQQRTLDDCVTAADRLMYEMKKQRHAGR